LAALEWLNTERTQTSDRHISRRAPSVGESPWDVKIVVEAELNRILVNCLNMLISRYCQCI